MVDCVTVSVIWSGANYSLLLTFAMKIKFKVKRILNQEVILIASRSEILDMNREYVLEEIRRN